MMVEKQWKRASTQSDEDEIKSKSKKIEYKKNDS